MMRPILRQAGPNRYYVTAEHGTFWVVNSHRTRKPWRVFLRTNDGQTRAVGQYSTKDAAVTALAVRLAPRDVLITEVVDE